MDINLDPGCCRAMDTDMALSGGPGPDDTVVPANNAGHSDQLGPCGGTALGHPYKLQVVA